MKTALQLLSALSLLLVTGCTEVGTRLANFPTRFDGISVHHNVVYDSVNTQKMDIYLPPDTSTTKHGVVVFFYGGRWTSGSKADYAFVGSAFAKAGYVVVIPDHRKYPAVRFPSFVQDAGKAVAWVDSNIEMYGGDAARIFVAGHSSGAHLGALIAADARYLETEGKQQSTIKAFAGMAGPYDFIPEEADLMDMFGPPEQYAQMQVPTFIDGQQPPMLLMWGDKDKAVGRFNLDQLKKAIDEKGGYVQTRIYPDVDHVWLVGSLSWLGKNKAPALKDMTAFFESTTKRSVHQKD